MQKYDAKYFTKSHYKKLMGKTRDSKIKERRFVNKSDLSGFIDHSDLDKKMATLATKTKIKSKQD